MDCALIPSSCLVRGAFIFQDDESGDEKSPHRAGLPGLRGYYFFPAFPV